MLAGAKIHDRCVHNQREIVHNKKYSRQFCSEIDSMDPIYRQKSTGVVAVKRSARDFEIYTSEEGKKKQKTR
jgi:hypothetical protein